MSNQPQANKIRHWWNLELHACQHKAERRRKKEQRASSLDVINTDNPNGLDWQREHSHSPCRRNPWQQAHYLNSSYPQLCSLSKHWIPSYRLTANKLARYWFQWDYFEGNAREGDASESFVQYMRRSLTEVIHLRQERVVHYINGENDRTGMGKADC